MMDTINPEELLLIGSLVGAFGVRGQVKLKAITDQPDHIIRHIRTIYLGTSSKRAAQHPPQPHQMVAATLHKPGLLVLTLKGVATRDAAELLRGAEVFIHERDAAPLEKDEFFFHQLYHLRVETTDGETIGEVREVLETGVHEVLVVARSGQPDALIPFIHQVVKQVDPDGGRIIIQVMEGLL